MATTRALGPTTRLLTTALSTLVLLLTLPAAGAQGAPALEFTGPVCQNGTAALLATWEDSGLPGSKTAPAVGTRVDLDTSASGYPAGSVQLTYAAVTGDPFYDSFTPTGAAAEYDVPSFEMGTLVQGPPDSAHTVDITFPHPVSIYLPILDVDTLESGTIEGFNGAAAVAGTVTVRDPSGGLAVSTAGFVSTFTQSLLTDYPDNDARGLLDVTFSNPVTRIRITDNFFAGSSEIGDIWSCQSLDVVKSATAPTVLSATSSTVTYHSDVTLQVANTQPSGQLRIYEPQATDDLGAVLAGAPAPTGLAVTAVQASGASSACVANASYDGARDTDLLAPPAGSFLLPGQACTITVGFDVTYPWTRSGFTRDNRASTSGAGENPTVHDSSTHGGTLPGSPKGDAPSPTPLVFPAWSPALELVKTADRTSLVVGQTVTYAFTAKNVGTMPLTAVAIAETSFTGSGSMSALGCVPAQPLPLEPQEELSCTATYVVTQTDVDAGAVRNAAVVSGRPPIGPNVTATDQATVSGTQGPALSLVKTASLTTDANRDGLAAVGDRLTFGFVVRNTGAVTVAAIGVADDLAAPAGPGVSVSCPDTTLSPGESVTCASSVYVVTQADVDAGAVRNTATASGTPPSGPTVVSPPSSTVTPTPGPGIGVVKSGNLEDHDGDGRADAGDTIVYRFVVTNTGATTLGHVEVDDGPLAALGLEVDCPTTTLAPGQAVTCTADPYVVTQSDLDARLVVNVATSSGTTPGGTHVTSPPSTSRVAVDPSGERPILPTTGSRAGDTAGLAVALLVLAGLVGLVRNRLGTRARQAG